jgi:hypothetical protein
VEGVKKQPVKGGIRAVTKSIKHHSLNHLLIFLSNFAAALLCWFVRLLEHWLLDLLHSDQPFKNEEKNYATRRVPGR